MPSRTACFSKSPASSSTERGADSAAPARTAVRRQWQVMPMKRENAGALSSNCNNQKVQQLENEPDGILVRQLRGLTAARKADVGTSSSLHVAHRTGGEKGR